MKRIALEKAVCCAFVAAVIAGHAATSYAQTCAVDAPEALVSGLFHTTGVFQNTLHYYDAGVPIDLRRSTQLTLHANSGAVYVRDSYSLVSNVAFPLSAPIATATAEGFLGEYATAVLTAETNGYVSRWDYLDGQVDDIWSRDLGRPGCGDSLGDIVVQPAAFSTDAFQAAHGNLVYAGTQYSSSCVGHNTDNKIYALNAGTGTVVWTFNEYESSDVDTVTGMAVDNVLSNELGRRAGASNLQIDHFHERLFVTTEATFDPSQGSVWSINTLFGTLDWSVYAGRIRAKPVVKDDRLYVANVSGVLKALNKTDGSELWSIQRFIPFVRDFAVGRRAPYDNLIVLTDYLGDVVLARDNGSSAEWLWTTRLDPVAGETATTSAAIDDINGDIYVGASDGKVYRLDITTGAKGLQRTVPGAGENVVALMRQSPARKAGAGFAYSLVVADQSSIIARYCTPFSDGRPGRHEP